MSDFLAGLLGVLLATNQPAAASNFISAKTGLQVEVANPNDPVERDYLKLLAEDNAAQAEVDDWINNEKNFSSQGAGLTEGTLRARIRQRLEPVRQRYEEFLRRHPTHARARIAFGSFLNDLGDEPAAKEQWEKARELAPDNSAVWNNLANHYGHNGEAKKAIEYYERAIRLAPNQSLYYQNLATTVYLFRKDAQELYKQTEAQVLDKAMDLYRKALALDPANFPLATDLAQTYYGLTPRPTGDAAADQQARAKHYADALAAWSHALKLARDDTEAQGVRLHLARVHIGAGHLAEARTNLALVTNQMFAPVKANLEKRLERQTTGPDGPAVNAPVAPAK